MTRHTLPNRRSCITSTTDWQGHAMTVTVGLYPFDIEGGPKAGSPGEVFADMHKGNDMIAPTLSDHCTELSIALQWGVPATAFGKSLGTVPVWQIVDGQMVEVVSHASPAGPIINAILEAMP